MSVMFVEPGGDADFGVTTTNGFWNTLAGAPAIATDIVHGSHLKSIKYRPSTIDSVKAPVSWASSIGRWSFYIYLVALPSTTKAAIVDMKTSALAANLNLYLTTAGVLQLWDRGTAQIGTDGATLSTGVWYRISLAFNLTSTSVNRFELYVDGVSSISITNATINSIDVNTGMRIGNVSNNAGLDFRSSDHYIDDTNSLSDTGNIWVTAKRPSSNGTNNQFTTQIGSGGSGYGSGHSPQINERALSTTNGWSHVGSGTLQAEEYNIESASAGDTNISTGTIVGYMGWASVSALVSQSMQLTLNNTTTNHTIDSTVSIKTAVITSASYPAGTGTDIGINNFAVAGTVSLYECGIIIAYIPGVPIPAGAFFQMF